MLSHSGTLDYNMGTKAVYRKLQKILIRFKLLFINGLDRAFNQNHSLVGK